jgi:hypothetical protein
MQESLAGYGALRKKRMRGGGDRANLSTIAARRRWLISMTGAGPVRFALTVRSIAGR